MIYEGLVHLHVHSHYSLLYSPLTVEKIIRECRARGIAAMALTDRGNIQGAVSFSTEAARHGIKAIIGCEFTLRLDDGTSGPIVVLIRDESGYDSLLELLGACWSEGRQDISQNLISLRELCRSSRGLVLLTGGSRGPVDRLLGMGQKQRAIDLVGKVKEVFGSALYMEVTPFRQSGSCSIDQIRTFAADVDIPCVAAMDVVALDISQEGARSLLQSLESTSSMTSSGDDGSGINERILASFADARHFFEIHEIEATHQVASLCDFDIVDHFRQKGPHYPEMPGSSPEGSSERLEALCHAMLEKKFGQNQQAIERLESEISAIKSRHLSGYFLAVREITSFCHRESIALGPGRGSSAGSLVACLLGITRVDPLAHGLLFERFLNPGRKTLPDIDIDVCARERGRVVDYLISRFGRGQVFCVAAFDTFQGKSALRAALAHLSVGRQKIDALMSQISESDDILASAMELETEAFGIPQSVCGRAIEVARDLIGVNRNRTRHAAGIIIVPERSARLLPWMDSDGPGILQFDKESLEVLGIPKIDLLALKTLTLLQDTVQSLACEGVELDFNNLPAEDSQAIECVGAASRSGIFQLDSSWMDRPVSLFHPQCFHDIVLLLALIRPGPMKGNVFSDVVKARKSGQPLIDDDYPAAWHEILSESSGTIVFQEQVMELASRIGGFSLAEADNLRRVMSKKSQDGMESYEARFIQGAAGTGLNSERARELFTRMAHFAGYGFNKSHSVAYAFLTYATGWLKAHHFAHFAVAYMNSELGNHRKIEGMIRECRERGMEILPPDINRSGAVIEMLPDGRIIWGLGLIRNVGSGLAEAIVRRRSEAGAFRDLTSIMSFASIAGIQRTAMEALGNSGALDGFGPRARVLSELAAGYSSAGRWSPGVQMSIFDVPSPVKMDSGQTGVNSETVPCSAELARTQTEVLGFSVYISPLEEYSWFVRAASLRVNGRGVFPREGAFLSVLVFSERKIQAGQICRVEDLGGGLNLNLSGYSGEACDGVLYVEGRYMDNGGNAAIVASRVLPIEAAMSLPWVVDVDFSGEEIDDDTLAALRGLVAVSSGHSPLCVRVETGKYHTVIRAGHVPLSRETVQSLEELTGDVPRVHLARGSGVS